MLTLAAAYWPHLIEEGLFKPRYLALVAGGAIGGLAAARLGQDGTYFGIELGIVKAQKNYVAKFPYGFIPHPMVLGQVVVFLVLHMNDSFRQAFPLLVPTHIALYALHTAQEHFDIRANTL